MKRLLFRLVAHAARIQQDHVRDVFRLRQGVALRDELGGDRLAVPFVHLAPVGFDVNTRHGCTRGEITRHSGGHRYALELREGEDPRG